MNIFFTFEAGHEFVHEVDKKGTAAVEKLLRKLLVKAGNPWHFGIFQILGKQDQETVCDGTQEI